MKITIENWESLRLWLPAKDSTESSAERFIERVQAYCLDKEDA